MANLSNTTQQHNKTQHNTTHVLNNNMSYNTVYHDDISFWYKRGGVKKYRKKRLIILYRGGVKEFAGTHTKTHILYVTYIWSCIIYSNLCIESKKQIRKQMRIKNISYWANSMMFSYGLVIITWWFMVAYRPSSSPLCHYSKLWKLRLPAWPRREIIV